MTHLVWGLVINSYGNSEGRCEDNCHEIYVRKTFPSSFLKSCVKYQLSEIWVSVVVMRVTKELIRKMRREFVHDHLVLSFSLSRTTVRLSRLEDGDGS